ncbi:hypothetical protein BG015_008845 [Linnemannia schmuckeri]|uniref:VPS9 domain-containing protein n=1 Tax=Linnemannia schmuckeri TaxID=64567 RepID=A0A9P5VEU9_9FUNG|nr:hypothetical protein BG015_008845 [Linnemannia schmuckeri]
MDLALSIFQQKQVQAPPPCPKPAPTTTSNHFLSLLFFHDSTSIATVSLVNQEQLKSFQFLRKTFEATLATMLRERNRHQLVILCPTQQSLIGLNTISGLEWEWGGIDEEFIMSHIVRIAERDHPVAKGLSVTTLNGRSLILTDTTVTTAKGFKLLRQARLVSEKIFYDNEGRGWIVQFIDRPLVGLLQEGQGPSSASESPVSNRSGIQRPINSPPIDKLQATDRQESTRASRRNRQRLGHFHTAVAYRETRRKNRARPLLTLQLALQRFPGVFQNLEKLIMDFNDAIMAKGSLEEIRSSVDRLLADSVDLLNQVDSKVLSALLDEYGVTVDILDQLLENHIMNSTYDIVFFKITSHLKHQDWELAEAIRELRNLDLGQVGLPDTPQHFQSIVSALNEFQSIGVLRTPEEKLACLVQTIRVTSSLSGGADDLIPILLLTVLRSGISNLASNLYYMKNFVLFGDASRGEYGYSLSTLEAVSRYILAHVKQLSPLSARNQEYWETICRGDIEGIKIIYAHTSDISNFQPVRPTPSRRVSAASLESGSDISIHSTFHISLVTSPMQSRDAEGNNGILLACKAQQVDMLRYLLQEQESSVVVANYEGKTPLMLAIELENVVLTRVILSALALQDKNAVNRQDVLGNTGMHMAAAKDNSTLLAELLTVDLNLGLPNNDGDTPLIIASKLSERSDQYCSAVRLLSSKMKSEELDRQNNRGDTAIHFITDTTLINHLVQCGANPEIENYAGWTPMLKWALHDNAAVVKCLLETGRVSVLMVDSRGYSPLHMACLRGNLEMVHMLQAHTPIDLQSVIDGSTPLQLACQSNSASVVEFLLQSGANPELRDWSNESPADMTSDSAILDMLDNAMLFWESRQGDGTVTVKASTDTIQKDVISSSEKTSSKTARKRLIRVVRGAVEKDGKIRYIVKSGSTADRSTIVTMPRSLDDFRFLRENLLVEGPDACIPSLEGFFSPFLLSPSRPSKTVLAISARRLDMFLNYLSDHPVLANHELVWEFMLMPELQREVISERSQCKQENSIDSIFDNYPPVVENLEHEETYFKFLNEEIVKLEKAVHDVWVCSRKLNRSAQDVPQELDLLSTMLDRADQINFDNKEEYVQALKSIAATQTTMYTSDIESLGNLFEDFSFVIEGTLKALQHPQEIINSIRQLRASAVKAEQSMRRSDMWWSGLSTIGEGAMTAFGGAGAALGAVSSAATSTFEAVSETITFSSTGHHQHTRSASEGVARKRPSIYERGRALSPQPISRIVRTPTTPPSSPANESTLVVKLPPPPSQSNNTATLTPVRPRSRLFQDLNSRNPSTSSSLTSPFTSIAAVASAAVGQVPLEDIQDKIGKASSLLNSLRGSLFEELAHLQSHHTKELERAMRDFGARQLQIEKSRLRDMMEILDDLRVETTASGTTPASVSGLESRMLAGSSRDVTQGRNSRGVSRQSSSNALGQIAGGLLQDRSSGLFGDNEYDEKAEPRLMQQYQANKNLQSSRSQSVHPGHSSSSIIRKDDNTLSEKMPFDG